MKKQTLFFPGPQADKKMQNNQPTAESRQAVSYNTS